MLDDDDLADMGLGDNDMKGEEIREQDRFLPVANIARIMKKILPNNAKITKDSKEAIQECVSEFISFITSEASDKCQQEKRKTINGDDLLWAMGTLGFDKYSEPLKLYLSKYREAVKGEKPEKKSIIKRIENSNSSHYHYQYSTADYSQQLPVLNATTTSVIVSNDTKVYSYETEGETIFYTTTNEGTNVQVYPQPDGTYIQYISYQDEYEEEQYEVVAAGTKRTQDEANINDDINDTQRAATEQA